MACDDEDFLVKMSGDEDHLDGDDPRVRIRQYCGLRCRPGCSHVLDVTADVRSSHHLYQPLLQADESSPDDSNVTHCHDYSSSQQLREKHAQSKAALSRLVCVAILCFLFMTAEWVGGYMANSLAIMSDAAHLLSDFGSFLVSILAIWLSLRPPTSKMTFGYHRAEVMGAAVSVAVIWLITGVLVYAAVERVTHGHYDIDADTMLVVSALGVLINIVMGAVLHGACASVLGTSALTHGHSHSSPQHSPLPQSPPPSSAVNGHVAGAAFSSAAPASSGVGHSTAPADASRNINLRAAFVHVIGDLIQSVGVLAAAVIVKLKPEFRMADPVCTFIFSVIVVATTVGVARDVVRIFMESAPANFCYREAVRDLQAIPGVVGIHEVCVWSLNIDRIVFTAHVAKDACAESDAVLREALSVLRRRHAITTATIQVESHVTPMENCRQCQLPDI